MIEIQCVVYGQVQGVAYRTYVQDAALELGLTGWVFNNLDGTVSVLAQGQRDILKDLVEYLHEGSLGASVESVAVDWHTAKRNYDDFSIVHNQF